MAVTGINSEDRLVQATFAAHLKDKLGWESVYAFNDETFGPGSTLGRASTSEAVLTRDLRAACQSAFKFDPVSASNFDPFGRRVLTVALVTSELAGIAETRRARVV